MNGEVVLFAAIIAAAGTIIVAAINRAAARNRDSLEERLSAKTHSGRVEVSDAATVFGGMMEWAKLQATELNEVRDRLDRMEERSRICEDERHQLRAALAKAGLDYGG